MTTQDYRTRSPLRIFLSYFKPHWKLFTLDISCAVLIAMVDLAFPLISSGVYGYPFAEALRIAVETIQTALVEQEMDVTLCLFGEGAWREAKELYPALCGE